MSFDNWTDGLTEVCSGFQAELSCIVDGEQRSQSGGSDASTRAMLHMEGCRCCRDFVEDTRRQVELHRDMADPDRLLARVAMLTGSDLAAEAAEIDLKHRLATIFYQLGKAYALAGIDFDAFRERIFEAAVPVDPTKSHGRGFVDGILMGAPATSDADSEVNWHRARHLLNGKLDKIEEPLEKGRRLLQEALTIDGDHEEARHYLALIHKKEGRSLRAADGFRDLFDTALSPENRIHAAINLGRVYFDERDFKRALTFWRWTLMFGGAATDDRFWVVRFNVALACIHQGRGMRAVHSLRALLDHFPHRAGEIAQALAGASPELRAVLDSQPAVTRALVEGCPELFQTDAQEGQGS